MFKGAIMVTTALVVATSMALAAGQGSTNSGPAHKTRVAKSLVQVGKVSRGFAPALLNTKPGTRPGKSADWQDIRTRGKTFDNFSRSANALFLSWYGWAAQANTGSGIGYHCTSTSCYSVGITYSVHQGAALKLTGTGNEVKKIELGAFEQQNYPSCVSWGSCHGGMGSVALYSNATGSACAGTSSHGIAPSCPGTAIKNASGTFSAAAPSALCCDVISVPIHKTTLAAGTQYWLYVTGGPGGDNAIAWDSEDSDFSQNPMGSMVYHFTFHTNFTTGAVNDYNSGWLNDNSGLYPGAAKL